MHNAEENGKFFSQCITHFSQISLFWRAQGFVSKGKRIEHLSKVLRKVAHQWKEGVINLVFTLEGII